MTTELPRFYREWDAQDAAKKAHSTDEYAPPAPLNGSISPYAQTALDRETANVATAAEGTRNHTLNTAAYNLGTLIAAGQLHQGDVESALRVAATTAGLEPMEISRTIRSGVDAGLAQPRQIPDRSTVPAPASNGAAPPPSTLPELLRLDQFLATPDETITYRIEPVWPTGGRVILAAAWKAGKTTVLGNLLRALVDAEPFLGHYPTNPARRVILIDDELDARTLRRWLRDQDIVNTDRIHLTTLRGKTSTFNIINPDIRTEWAAHIGPADVLLFDCLRPVLDALGLDESHDAGRFLVAFDALLAETQIPEAIIAHHMGHIGERSRGDSRLRDWPDAEWRLVRDKSSDEDGETNPAAPRYFAAYGRDVDQAEQLLGYQPDTRRLVIAGGSRKNSHLQALINPILRYIGDNPACSQNSIETHVTGNAKKIREAIQLAINNGQIHREKAPDGTWIHTLVHLVQPRPGRTDEVPRPLVPPLKGGDEDETPQDPPTPETEKDEVNDPDYCRTCGRDLDTDGACRNCERSTR